MIFIAYRISTEAPACDPRFRSLHFFGLKNGFKNGLTAIGPA
jgi:hypothetical protein